VISTIIWPKDISRANGAMTNARNSLRKSRIRLLKTSRNTQNCNEQMCSSSPLQERLYFQLKRENKSNPFYWFTDWWDRREWFPQLGQFKKMKIEGSQEQFFPTS